MVNDSSRIIQAYAPATTMATTLLRRHARVWLEPAALANIKLSQEEQRAAIERHARLRQPFVLRRLQPCDNTDGIPLGLRLPRSATVRSLSFTTPHSSLKAVAEALPLFDALATTENLPTGWQAALQLLDSRATDLGICLRVYGSLAWQSATGIRYVEADSDVDLLLRPQSATQVHACLALLDAASRESDVRLDGEIEFPDGRAVAWKELLGKPQQILIKTKTKVDLIKTEALWNQAAWH